MPFVKTAAGGWIQAANVDADVDRTARLVIVDKQVDPDGSFQQALQRDIVAVEFDSEKHTQSELLGRIRAAHRAHGKPFASIAFANHGPSEATGPWVIAQDLVIPTDCTSASLEALTPLVEVLVSVLEPTTPGRSHIIFLACNLAAFSAGLIPALEALYHIDFMGSTDKTGIVAAGGNWKMETDDFDFAQAYCIEAKLGAYRQTMGRLGRNIGWVAGKMIGAAAGGPVGEMVGAEVGARVGNYIQNRLKRG